MPSLSIDSRTYRRLVLFAEGAGISIHAAATDAVDNWMDLAHDPQLAVTALCAIAVQTASDRSVPAAAAAPSLPANVTYIDAVRSRNAKHRFAASRRHGGTASEKVSR